MALLIGTRDGVFRSRNGTLDDIEQVLDAGRTLRIRTFENHEGVFAATKTGLYRSADDETTWENLGVPRTEVFSVVGNPDGTRLYAGTHPAHLYVSTDHGETWDELDGFQELPSRNQWHTPRHRNEAHVRSLGVHPDAPERVIAGVEVGGIHVSDDNGETWTERRDGLQAEQMNLQYDVHHVLVLGADEWVVSCGGGLYRTRDAGHSWTRLNPDPDRPYFQEAVVCQDRLYTAAQTLPPGSRHPERGADAALVESKDGGDTFEAVSYPGEPTEVAVAWTVVDGRVLAGASGRQLIIREDDGWATLGSGSVPAGIQSLTSR